MNFSKIKLEEDSISVIAIPSFAGRAPEVAIDRLKMISGNGSKAIVVAVYGNRAQEDTLIEMSNTARDCNYDVIAGIEAISQHSIAPEYATGRPDANDRKQLEEFVRKIKAKLDSKSDSMLDIPGNFPYKKYGSGLAPKASSKCVSCGLCANRCPIGAIDRGNCRKTNKKICIGCMRCVSICPQDARSVSSIMRKIVSLALKKDCKNPKENRLYI